MGDCYLHHDEIRLSVRDPEKTEVWVYIRGEGDCPFQCIGWRYKAYPAAVTAVDILQMWDRGELNPMEWPRMDPPPTVPNYTPDWDALEAQALALLAERGENLND